MRTLSEIYKKNGALHHAYAIQGSKENVMPELLKFLESDFGVKIKNNPDFFYQEFETFTIDDGRDLQERHLRRAIGSKKVFIIVTRFITVEAQNALLKLFEEPTQDTHLFLVMPNTQTLLPTLKSRLVMLNYENADLENGAQLAKKFLSEKPAGRLILVKKMIEEKDRGAAIDLVTAIERALSPRLHTPNSVDKKNSSEPSSETARSLTEVLLVKKYLHDRAPSTKLLLEHICLILPIF